jgi:hypothetical protein
LKRFSGAPCEAKPSTILYNPIENSEGNTATTSTERVGVTAAEVAEEGAAAKSA